VLHCGAEITNLNFSSGKRQWLWMVPLFLLIGYQFWHMYRPKGDYRRDLQIRVLETRKEAGGTAVLGTIQNSGRTTWESINLSAEFFDAKGKFSTTVAIGPAPSNPVVRALKLVLQGRSGPGSKRPAFAWNEDSRVLAVVLTDASLLPSWKDGYAKFTTRVLPAAAFCGNARQRRLFLGSAIASNWSNRPMSGWFPRT